MHLENAMFYKKYEKTFDFVTICVLTIFGGFNLCQASGSVSDVVDSFALEHLHGNKSENYLSVLSNSVNNVKSFKSNHNELPTNLCGGTFRDRQVVINSPQYPNNYPKNLNCEYLFYSPFVCTAEFHIQFLDFLLEPSLNCSKDKVTIGADEVLCGQVIGIMKYKVKDGVLRINFITDSTIENMGFKLLVTRLPCTDDNSIEHTSKKYSTATSSYHQQTISNEIVTEIPRKDESEHHSHYENLLPEVAPKSNNNVPSNSWDVPPSPIDENFPQITHKPSCPDQTTSNGLWTQVVAQPSPFVPNYPPTIPSCCANVFNQKRVFIISARFPSSANFVDDCLYYIDRSQPNICRLRIEFKYFNLGIRQYNQCLNSFVEIDGRRFCGCRSGFVYHTPMSYGPKAIRFTNWPINRGTQGFVLDITQEECPIRRTLPIAPLSKQIIPNMYHQNYLLDIIKPNRCYLDYAQWLRIVSNQNFLAQSICVRNFFK